MKVERLRPGLELDANEGPARMTSFTAWSGAVVVSML